MSKIKWMAAAGLVTFGGWMVYRWLADEAEEEDISQWTAASVYEHEQRMNQAQSAETASGDDRAFVSSCPQDLSAIKGVGRTYERKLYAAGIGSYWQLANLPATELAAIFDVQDFQAVDVEGIQAGARQLAETTGSVGRTWDGGQADALTAIEGLGDTYERRLFNAGICTYAALAATTPERLVEICQAPDWRKPDYAAWIAEAKNLAV
ncbi:MAG: helix-hairpin-helix domain-containing protein [Caldilineales bacterium]|nr:helix-hairpin-helix domain-containing protein [Caldilineales bacterium]